MYGTGWFGDRFHVRGPPCAFNAVLAIIGLAILGFAGNGGVRYFGVFLATAGANANIPVAMSYQVCRVPSYCLPITKMLTPYTLGQQHQRPMEARLLLCYPRRLRRSWWYRRHNDIQIRGPTGLCPRH